MGDAPVQVLLIEDTEPDVYLVREALKRAGGEIQLLVVNDGEKAVQLIDRMDLDENTPCPQLVLLDLNLPKKSGEQVLEHMRRSRRCGHIPVIIVSSSDSPRDKAQAERLGATQYFRKPSSLREYMQLGPMVFGLLGQT